MILSLQMNWLVMFFCLSLIIKPIVIDLQKSTICCSLFYREVNMSENSFRNLFARGFRGINKLICCLPTEQKDFIKSLKFDLAHTAKNLYPDKSIADLSKITGLARGPLSEFLDEEEPEKIVSKESIILSELWHHKDENDAVPLKGESSFYSIAKDILNSSYSPSTALDSLLELKAVKLFKLGDGNVSVILLQNHLDIAIKEKYELYINQIGLVIDKFSDTVIYNMQSKDLNYQQTFNSSQVPISSQYEAHLAMKSLANDELMPKMGKCIESFEVDVPLGTYPLIGFSMFEYRDNNKTK